MQSQPADGYTILVGAIGQLAIATAIYPNLPFHPTKTLVPLTLLGSYWLAIAGSMHHGIASLAELVAVAKANPDKSNYPSSSPAFTIPAELLKLRTGIPGQMIPYKSTNEMMLSIASGQTLFGFADPPIVIPLARAGKIPLARHDRPEPPARTGRGTDRRRGGVRKHRRPVAVDRCIRHRRDTASGRAELHQAIRRALADPAASDKLKAVAYAPDGRSGEEFRQLIDADIKAYADVVRTANLKFD